MEKNKLKLQEELQRNLLELEIYKKKFENLTQEMQMVELSLVELDNTKKAINILKNEKSSGETLVSIGSGVYSKANNLDNEKVLLGIGAGFYVEKTIDEASKILDERMEKLSKVANEIQKNASDVSDKISELSNLSEDLLRELQK
ncbi:MAG: prefoldin subunit alpha [Candidatus Altiarchaeota archaeon]